MLTMNNDRMFVNQSINQASAIIRCIQYA